MNIMWAPWRLEYVEQGSKKKSKGCVFCGILKANKDKKHFISFTFLLFIAFPYALIQRL